MDKNKILKYVGTGLTVIGVGALFVSGTSESDVVALVPAVFVIGGLILSLIRG